MMKRISDLSAAGGVADTDELELNQSGASRKATIGQIVGGLASAAHQHDLAAITDAGALAALDAVGTAEIDAAAYASQNEAVAGTDNAKLMTALRTAEAIAAQAAEHQHELADITDAGALAGLDTVGTAEIDAAAYASQSEAVAGTDGSKIMTALRTAEAIAAQAAEHQHELADITDAGALAGKDAVGTAEIDAAAYASQSEAVAGTDNVKIMTALRTAEAIAAQAAPQEHQHDLADITDAGALAALDAVGTAEIDAAAYASQGEAAAGTDNAKLMTALRTAEAIAAQVSEHQHELADITDAGTLAALDSVGTAEIDAAAYASQGEAVAGTDNAKIMTALRTAEAIAAQAAPQEHEHALADIIDAGALAGLDTIGTAEINAAAYASQAEAEAGTDNAKLMTAARTVQAIVARAAPQEHQHDLAHITDAGALAALDQVGASEITPNAVTSDKILVGAVTIAKLADGAVTQDKIADGAVGAGKLQPGIPIDMQDAVLRAPELCDYSETSPAPEISSGTLTLDLENGNVFEVILTEDVTSLILAHPPAAGRAGSCSIILRQDATGARTLAWPSSVKWAGGAPPPITSAAGAVDVYALITRDGGATWFGFPGGQDFS
jgi:hypothetical protein